MSEILKISKYLLLLLILLTSVNAQTLPNVALSDGTNQLLRFTDEGTFGAIQFINGTPSVTTRKLYSESDKLYFNGNMVGGNDNDWKINNNDMYSLVSGNVGVNNTTPAFTLDIGGDLNFSGRLYVNGQAGSAGQVLTSSGPNNPPTWVDVEETPGFQAYLNQNLDLSGGTNPLTDTEEIYDYGNTYNPITGTFSAPSDGLYHFDYKLGFASTTVGVNGEVTAAIIKVNNVTATGGKFVKRIWTNSTAGEAVMFSMDLELLAGDEVTFHFSYPAGFGIRVASATNTTAGEATLVSGFKIN